jgi:hypothetical protein
MKNMSRPYVYVYGENDGDYEKFQKMNTTREEMEVFINSLSKKDQKEFYFGNNGAVILFFQSAGPFDTSSEAQAYVAGFYGALEHLDHGNIYGAMTINIFSNEKEN